MRKPIAAVCIIAAAATSGTALAHHSFAAEYDGDKLIKITGTVTEMRWSNPHGWIYIDVTDASGNTVNWALETGASNNLIRRGWRKEDLPVGTVIAVEGWHARNGSPTANIETATLPDGRRLFAGSSNQQSQQP